MKRRNRVVRPIVAAALLSAIVWLTFHRGVLEPSALQRELLCFGRLAPIFFVLFYAVAAVLFVPGSIITVTGGVLFGPLWGTLWNLTGATLGATLAFVTARYVASDWVSRRAGERLTRLIRGVEEEGWRFVAFARLVPLFPFNLVNYAFGLTRIRLGEYVLTSFVCMVPGALAYTYLGYAGRQAASGQAGAIREGLLALALLAVVAFLPRLVRRFKGSPFIDPAGLERRLESGEAPALVDVRTAEEFRGPLGHIADAINIPIAELSERLRELTALKGKPLVTI
jgi:uncharacterized membrane protein YdjX (TVP38/TMEM64 family)